MGVPFYNIVATQISAAASYSTALEVQNYSNAAVQVIWSGVDATNGTIRCKASNRYTTDFQNLSQYPITMVASAGNHMFNIYDIGYSYLQIYYDPGSNTAGTIDLVATRKAFG